MALTATIPTALQDFIPESERTPNAFAEAWRYTPVAGLAIASAEADVQRHVVTRDVTLQLDIAGAMSHEIAVQAGCTLTLIERVLPGQTLAQHTIAVGTGATVNHIRITECTADDFAVLQTHTQLAEDAAYHFYTITTGAKRLRQRVQVGLQGKGAHTTLAGAYVLNGAAHHDFSAIINHRAPNCTSRQHFKGVVRDTARGAFQGKIHVTQAAQETEAYQLHRALLLGERAEVDAKPELEIYADRVKCSHGNAIGELDMDALFYLKARGIDEAMARQLLTQAFLADTLDYASLQKEELEAKLLALLEARDE